MTKPLTIDLSAFQLPSASSKIQVKTEFPAFVDNARVAVIGDCPTERDELCGRPFSDGTGEVLRNVLAAAGISPTSVMYDNIVPRSLRYDSVQTFPWNDVDYSHLREALEKFQPNIVVLAGDVPLWAAGKRGESVSNWHGSLFMCETIDSPFYGYKCLATFDIKQVMKVYENLPLMRFDLRRAGEEATTRELELPKRNFELHLSAFQIIDKLRELPANKPIAVDIEGYYSWISCLSIATDAHNAFIVPFGVFSPEEDALVIEQLRITMARQDLPKILQNCVYDYFVLAFRYHIVLENIVVDTMLSGWELYPELPKGLGTQTAIWTREPYYKFQRKVDNTVTHWKYCCTDSCVTYEIAEKHLQAMSADAIKHFKFNMALLPAINYMQYRGIAFDKPRADELAMLARAKQEEIQMRINRAAGKSVNVNSPKQLGTILYAEMRFPKQHPKVAGRIDKTKVTTNIDALLELNRHYDSPFIRDLIAWRKCEKMLQTLAMPPSARDGRMRCSYNLVGTDTGRLNCYSSAEQSEVLDRTGKEKDVGANLTTVTKKLRCLFLADPGHEFFQLDLAGADGWTVAAHCARFGDPTMLDDYHFGIKPARIIAYLYQHGTDALKMSRAELHEASKTIGNDEATAALYFISKRVQHGTNYLLGPTTMADQILKDSFKWMGTPIYVDHQTCVQLQKLYLLRYRGVKAWHAWLERELKSTGRLSCASGHVRTFFGRRTAHDTLRSFTAHEPQANTTYALNLALFNLWHDPENRRKDQSLIVEPLHHVHDAMCGQWPLAERSFAIRKLREWFNNPITVGGITFTIPFEGEYGRSWGELEHKI